MLRRGEITIDKRPRRNGTKRYPPPEARIKINSRGSSFSLHRDRGRKGEKERVQQDSFSFFLSRPRLNYPNHLSTTTWRFKLINLCAFWILSNLRACTGCVITCSHEPAFMLTLVMHYVINAQHRAQETPTVHSCACCSLLYGIYLPFPISFLSLSLLLFCTRLCDQATHEPRRIRDTFRPTFPSSPKQTRIRKSGTRVLFYSPLTEHRFDWIECRWGEEVGDKWGEKRGEEIKGRERGK